MSSLTTTIERYSEDELERKYWRFSLIDSTIVLDAYWWGKKETTRKKNYNMVRYYTRLGGRLCNTLINEVDIPSDLFDEAIRSLTK